MDTNNYGDGLEQQIYVIPGHYRNKYEGGETEGGIPKLDVIRVYGPDPKKEGFWICDDGKSRTDSNILDNYQLMDLAPSKESASNNSHLFADFETIEPPKKKQHQPTVQPTVQPTIEAITPAEVAETFKLFPEQEPINVDVAIIEKLNILTYNDSIIEKYGDTVLCKPIKNIGICFDIPFMYDLDNLRKTVTMLNLDEKVISEYLTNRVLDVVDIKSLLNREIINMLTDINYSLKTEKESISEHQQEPQSENKPEYMPEPYIQEPYPKIQIEPENQPQQEISPELSEGIENIGKYLAKYF